MQVIHMCGSRGGGAGGPDPPPPPSLKNHENIGLLGNSGPDPLKNHEATEPAFNAGGPMMVRFLWYFEIRSSHRSSTEKKNVVKVGPLWQNFLDPRMRNQYPNASGRGRNA